MNKQPTDRRLLSGHKSFLRGCIYFNKCRSSLDCVVRDISATGARLIFPENVREAYIPQKEQTPHAQVQWCHGNEIGVGFATRAWDEGGDAWPVAWAGLKPRWRRCADYSSA